MAAANNSSEKTDLLVYGPIRPILENGFSDQFVLHKAETRADLERLTPDVLANTRGIAVTQPSGTTTITATYYLLDAAAPTGMTGTEITIGTTTTDAAIDGMLRAVESALQSLTDSASTLGAITKRIDMQDDFVSTLMGVIEKGVGRLVDADMNEESTRLKALQTQQQLGIQSLSIANTNAENILQLFKS